MAAQAELGKQQTGSGVQITVISALLDLIGTVLALLVILAVIALIVLMIRGTDDFRDQRQLIAELQEQRPRCKVLCACAQQHWIMRICVKEGKIDQ